MVDWSKSLEAILIGSGGAGVIGVVVAAIQSLSRSGTARAEAANLVTRAAGEMGDRLHEDNIKLREAVLLLTDVLDEVLPQIQAPGDAVEKLKKAKRAAQLAI
jgi:hypothetical protein